MLACFRLGELARFVLFNHNNISAEAMALDRTHSVWALVKQL
jgi:hypothetical protein